MDQKSKIIFSSALARQLIKKGYKIIDIEPMNTDSKRTVFVFEMTEGLLVEIDTYKNENKTKEKALRK